MLTWAARYRGLEFQAHFPSKLENEFSKKLSQPDKIEAHILWVKYIFYGEPCTISKVRFVEYFRRVLLLFKKTGLSLSCTLWPKKSTTSDLLKCGFFKEMKKVGQVGIASPYFFWAHSIHFRYLLAWISVHLLKDFFFFQGAKFFDRSSLPRDQAAFWLFQERFGKVKKDRNLNEVRFYISPRSNLMGKVRDATKKKDF